MVIVCYLAKVGKHVGEIGWWLFAKIKRDAFFDSLPTGFLTFTFSSWAVFISITFQTNSCVDFMTIGGRKWRVVRD